MGLLGLFCCLAGQAVAEPIAEVRVTGTVISDDLIAERIPREMITAEDIVALSPSTVVDLLRGIPGVDVTQQGGEGGLTFISLRGGDPNFTVVMIDGVKVDDPTNSRGGGYDFVGLDPLMIERVEVFFGSYSAVYGSDALGGVISVTTKAVGSARSASVDLEVGTDDGWAGAVQLAGPLVGHIEAGLSVAARQSNDAVEGDSMERQQVAINISRAPSASDSVDWGLRFFASNVDASAFPVASGGDQLALIRRPEVRDIEQLIAAGELGWAPTHTARVRLSGAWSQYEEANNSPGIAPGTLSGVPPVKTDSSYERANLALTATVSAHAALSLGVGGELIREDGEIFSLIDLGVPVPADFSETRDTWALFAEAALQLHDQVNLVAGVRHDDAENLDSTNTRVAANWDFPRTGTSTWLIYAEGFKLPSLFAQGHPLTGNSDLVPEESENLELRIDQSAFDERLDLSLSLFRNEFTNLVDFDPEIYSHVNRSGVTATGVNFDVTASLSHQFRVSGSVGFLDTDTTEGIALERRPDWKGGLTLSWRPNDAFLATVRGVYNGEFYDVSVPTGLVLLDDYTRMDASVLWALSQNVEFKLMLNNVLDSDYEESAGFSNPGRQIRIGISARL